MFFDRFDGLRARLFPPGARSADRPSLAEAKREAWALAVGGIRSPEGGRYRISASRRAGLPDLDFALVVPARPKPSTLRRLLLRLVLRWRRPPLEGGAATQGGVPALGSAALPTYMERHPAPSLDPTEALDASHSALRHAV